MRSVLFAILILAPISSAIAADCAPDQKVIIGVGEGNNRCAGFTQEERDQRAIDAARPPRVKAPSEIDQLKARIDALEAERVR